MSTIDHLLEAAGTSAAGVCEQVLMTPIHWIPNIEPSLAPRLHVAVSLKNDQVAMYVGLVARWESYSYFTRLMMNMSSEDPLGDQDVNDGIGEMVNMIAGQLKKQVSDKYPSLKIGFPTIQLETSSGIQSRAVETATKPISIGVYDAEITVMLKQN